MVNVIPVKMPKFSANDDAGILVEWLREEGQSIKKGELLCSIETMKSVFELEAPADGYVIPLLEAGDRAEVGAAICAIADQPISRAEALQLLATPAQPVEEQASIPVTGDGGITLKAQMLAKRYDINPADLNLNGKKITEEDIQKYADGLKNRPPAAQPPHDLVLDTYPAGRVQRILILGGGDGAVQVLDVLAKTSDQRAVAILDDNAELHGKALNGVPVSGKIDIDQIAAMFERGEFDAAVISISTLIWLRAQLFEKLKARGVPFANVIHPSVVKGMNVSMGEGNVIMAFTHLGACATLGDNNFISAYCSIEHHNTMGDHCSFGPGVITSSRVAFGDKVRCGTGIFIEPKIDIGANAVIGSGCIIRRNVPEGSVLKTRLNYVERQRP